VLELPNSALGPKRVGLWARTLDGAGGVWIQADRGALPAQAVFLVGSERDSYHAGEPANDTRFIAVFAHALEHTGGYAPEGSKAGGGNTAAGRAALRPDASPVVSEQWPYAHRGCRRRLPGSPHNGKVIGDKVGPHIDLLTEFLYLGPPHNGCDSDDLRANDVASFGRFRLLMAENQISRF